MLLLREVDKQYGLTQRLASVLNDSHHPALIRHTLETMTWQRIFGVAAGYEDLNDHEALRFDQARSWKFPRWVVARLEEGELGSNPRFVISSRYDDGFKLYYEQHCNRGDMENRIKDQQVCLFADRSSSTQWWTNQWRLILFGFAYILFEGLRAYLKRRPSRK